MTDTFNRDLEKLMPFLRAFARTLTQKQTEAEDLAQETLMKAWQYRHTFTPGTNLKAWLFTILRNQFYTDRRRAWRQLPWDQEAAERMPGNTGSVTQWHMDLQDAALYMTLIPKEQRDALVLVGMQGWQYDRAALELRCAVGTVKSRVTRARRSLRELQENPHVSCPGRGAIAGWRNATSWHHSREVGKALELLFQIVTNSAVTSMAPLRTQTLRLEKVSQPVKPELAAAFFKQKPVVIDLASSLVFVQSGAEIIALPDGSSVEVRHLERSRAI